MITLDVFVDALGFLGVIIVLAAYILIQADRLDSHDFAFPFMNFVGALLILCSLYFNWNGPAFLVEFMWALISLWGIFKSWKIRSNKLTS